YQGELWHVRGHDRPGGHGGPCADPDRCDAHRPRTDRGALGDGDTDRIPVRGALQRAVRIDRPRISVVGQNHGWTDEHPRGEFRGFVNQRMLLDLAVVTDPGPGSDVGTSSDDAVR